MFFNCNTELIVRRQSLRGKRSDSCSTHLRVLRHRMATKSLQMNASNMRRMRQTISLNHKLAPHLHHLRQTRTSARKSFRKSDHYQTDLCLVTKFLLSRTTTILPGSGERHYAVCLRTRASERLWINIRKLQCRSWLTVD